jgi:hypothetical protein
LKLQSNEPILSFAVHFKLRRFIKLQYNEPLTLRSMNSRRYTKERTAEVMAATTDVATTVGRMQVDSIQTRVESVYGFSA